MVLSERQILQLLADLEPQLSSEDCYECECYLGFLTQLALDTQEKVEELKGRLSVERERIHGCQGCQPCPPADALALYLMS